MIYKIYTQKIYNKKIQKINKKLNSKIEGLGFDFFESFECQISIDNIFPGCSHIFSNVLWGILAFPKLNKTGLGSQKHVKTLRNHENWGFWPLK